MYGSVMTAIFERLAQGHWWKHKRIFFEK